MPRYRAVNKIIIPRGALSHYSPVEPETDPGIDGFFYDYSKNDAVIPKDSCMIWDGEILHVIPPVGLEFLCKYPLIESLLKSNFVIKWHGHLPTAVPEGTKKRDYTAYNAMRKMEATKKRLVAELNTLAPNLDLISEVMEVCEFILMRGDSHEQQPEGKD